MDEGLCELTARRFSVSPRERRLRTRFGFSDLPRMDVPFRLRELGAFWPHWNLHRRTCDKTGRTVISIFRPDCPYPVWDRSEWIAHADPPSAFFDPSKSFFQQTWDLFRRCPLPHTFQSHNQNCEYTDDFYHSRDCYLCHSSGKMQDCRYCYYCDECKDSQFTIYSRACELCSDVINCTSCYQTVFAVSCRQVNSCAFVYDCRNCSDCMLCSNLRGKRCCFANVQLSEQEYFRQRSLWDLRSRAAFNAAKSKFDEMLCRTAWHRALFLDHCESSTGNYLSHCKDCEDCFLSPYHEDCVHDAISGPHARTTLDSLGTIGTELAFYTAMCVFCYEVRFSFELNECRFCDYCMYCLQCKNCFGCCGLKGEQYCIFNKRYSSEDYRTLRDQIIQKMKEHGEWGRFFPAYFAPNPYSESCSSFYFPLSDTQQQALGFRTAPVLERRTPEAQPCSSIPDSASFLVKGNVVDKRELQDFTELVFWDDQAQRPLRLTREDVINSLRLGAPLPNSYYIRRVQENFGYIPFNGALRTTSCALSGEPIQTSWLAKYDGRILCEDEYLKKIA